MVTCGKETIGNQTINHEILMDIDNAMEVEQRINLWYRM